MPTYQKIALVLAGLLLVVTLSISILLLHSFDRTDGFVLKYDHVQFSSDKKSAEVLIFVDTDEIRSMTDKGAYLIVPPFNVNWYQVTINGKIVGTVGHQGLKAYIEKYTGVFCVNPCLTDSTNEIKIILKSNDKIELNSDNNPIIYEVTKANRLLFLERTLRNAIIHIAIGVMLAGFCIFILLFYVENKSRIFLIYSIVSLVAPISLLSGLDFNYFPISILWFNKIMCIAFNVAVMSAIAYAKLLNEKYKKMYNCLYFVIVILMIVTICLPTMESYRKFSLYRDIVNLLVINICGLFIIIKIIVKNTRKQKLVNLMLLLPIGVLSFISVASEREIMSSFAFIFMEIYFFKTIVDEIIKNKEHIDELKLNTIMIKMKAERDNLTGLYNQEAILKKVEQAETNTSIAIIDIDQLKKINDEFGHNIGTKSIALIGEAFMRFFPEDKIGRYGGDEFILISKTSPYRLVNQLKHTKNWIQQNGKLIHANLVLTISGGVAIKSDGITAEEVLEEADRLLYEGKTSGRNCIMRHIVEKE